MYKRVIHLFVLSCKKATFLIEKQLHTSLSPMEKLQLRTHLSICKNCATYECKALFLDRLMANEQIKEQNCDHFSQEEVSGLKTKIKTAIIQSRETDSAQVSSAQE